MSKARFHSTSNQAPAESALPAGCTEEGIASFVHWDAWADPELPVQAIKKEMEMVGVDPHDGDNVIVWVGSNFIHARKRMSTLIQTIDTLQSMKVKMVWDSPTFQDEAIMSAASTHDAGRDPRSRIPVTFTSIKQRKTSGYLGSNEYKTEKELFNRGLEIPTTKRWQLTNRYRGLQCDGMHTDMRARDPLFYAMPCPMGQQRYGQSTYCTWVEPFKKELSGACPLASACSRRCRPASHSRSAKTTVLQRPRRVRRPRPEGDGLSEGRASKGRLAPGALLRSARRARPDCDRGQ